MAPFLYYDLKQAVGHDGKIDYLGVDLELLGYVCSDHTVVFTAVLAYLRFITVKFGELWKILDGNIIKEGLTLKLSMILFLLPLQFEP